MGDYGHGPFPDTPMGNDPIVDVIDPFDDRDYGGGGVTTNKKSKKNKNGNDNDLRKDATPFYYEGYSYEPLPPRPGEKITWGRCGRRQLNLEQSKLVAIVKEHQRRSRKSAAEDFSILGPKQQGVIDHMIKDKRLNEKSTIAEWTFADIQKMFKPQTGFLPSARETKSIQVILKRIDKSSTGEEYGRNGVAYAPDDVIDLSIPPKKRKDKNKEGGKKVKHRDSLEDIGGERQEFREDPLGNINGLPDQRDYYPDQRQELPREPYLPPPPPHAPMAPPPGQWQDPNPFDNRQFHQDHNAPYPPNQPNFRPNARQFIEPQYGPLPPHPPNDQFDPRFDNRDYPHPHGARVHTRSPRRDDRDRERSRDRSRSRSRSKQRRRSSMRQPSRNRSRDRRRQQSRRRSDDGVDMLQHRFNRMWADRDSERSSVYDDGRSMWSRSDRGGRYDHSPDTSIYSEDLPPRGTLNRGKRYHDDPQYRRQYRAQRYRDMNVDIEPGYGHRSRDRSFSTQAIRPKLQQRITYDDYPTGARAEPRLLRAPPTRRMTDFAGGFEYDDREREPVGRYGRTVEDRVQEAYVDGRQDEMRRGKRTSYERYF